MADLIIGMFSGALILLAGFLVGWLAPGRRRHPKLPKLPKAICGCDHHYSMHDPKKGMVCTVGIYVDGKHRGKCACARYTGPVPLPEYVAPELAEG